jgi:hypothetical protein
MAIQGIEGVISQLQATAMTARNQNVADQQPSISFAGNCMPLLTVSVIPRPQRARRQKSSPSVSRAWR